MSFSPFIVVIGVTVLLALGLLLIVVLEEKLDRKTAYEFEQDVAYNAMLLELREMEPHAVLQRPLQTQYADITPLYQGGI